MSKTMDDKGCVIGIDHMQELYGFAKSNISKNHRDLIDNKKIKLIVGEGKLGYKEEAPYDCIHVGAVVKEPPKDLLEQLKVGGRMIMPLYNNGEQFIYIIDKKSKGFKASEGLSGLSVCYSPLTTIYEQLHKLKIKSH